MMQTIAKAHQRLHKIGNAIKKTAQNKRQVGSTLYVFDCFHHSQGQADTTKSHQVPASKHLPLNLIELKLDEVGLRTTTAQKGLGATWGKFFEFPIAAV